MHKQKDKNNKIAEKVKHYLKITLEFLFNPRLLFCFGVGWIITNGWAYVAFGIATWKQVDWLLAVSGTYLTLLWIPATPEKIITVAIAIFLLKVLFPDDTKTLGRLYEMKEKIKNTVKKNKNKDDVQKK